MPIRSFLKRVFITSDLPSHNPYQCKEAEYCSVCFSPLDTSDEDLPLSGSRAVLTGSTCKQTLQSPAAQKGELRNLADLARSGARGAGCEMCDGLFRYFRRDPSIQRLLGAEDGHVSQIKTIWLGAKQITVHGAGLYSLVSITTEGGQSFGKNEPTVGVGQRHLPVVSRESLNAEDGYSNGHKQSINRLQTWLRLCTNEHGVQCNVFNSSFVPQRLLFIRSRAGRQGEQVPVLLKLVEMPPLGTRYVTLSHRWGDENSVIHKTRLLRSCLSNYLEHGIPVSQLPGKMRDAAWLSRELGFEYIWIDSYCIIQDEGDPDKLVQIAQMADIYANSELTIGATGVGQGEETLFQKIRLGVHRIADSKDRPDDTSNDYYYRTEPSVYIKRDHAHPMWDTRLAEFFGFSTEKTFELLSRGWVYQERLLSRRFVHLFNGCMKWECNARTICDGCDNSNTHQLAELDNHDDPDLGLLAKKGWTSIVRQYSTCNLGRATDRLLGLSGVARRYAELRNWTYVMGHFWESFHHTFFWATLIEEEEYLPEWPEQRLAPSRSWPALNTRINAFKPCDPKLIEFINFISPPRDSQTEYEPDRYLCNAARLEETRLVIRGPVISGKIAFGSSLRDLRRETPRLKPHDDWDDRATGFSVIIGNVIANAYSDFNWRKRGITSGSKVLFLICSISEEDFGQEEGSDSDSTDEKYNSDCLILRRTNNLSNVFERIGHFWCCSKDPDWLLNLASSKVLQLN